MTKLSKETQEAVRAIVADDDCYIVTEQDQPVSVRTLGGQYWEISFGRWSAFYDEKDMIPEDIETMQRAADETAGRLPEAKRGRLEASVKVPEGGWTVSYSDEETRRVALKAKLDAMTNAERAARYNAICTWDDAHGFNGTSAPCDGHIARDAVYGASAWAIDCACGKTGTVVDYAGDGKGSVRREDLHKRAGEVTKTTVADLFHATVYALGWDPSLDFKPVRFVALTKSDAFRGAMEAMSNVASAMRMVLQSQDIHDEHYGRGQREQIANHMTPQEMNLASERWSRAVRAKVAALKPPGLVVSCQGDWEED